MLPGSTSAGTAVGDTVKTARQTPFRACSGTVRSALSEGTNVALRPDDLMVCGREKSRASLATAAVTLPPEHRRRV